MGTDFSKPFRVNQSGSPAKDAEDSSSQWWNCEEETSPSDLLCVNPHWDDQNGKQGVN